MISSLFSSIFLFPLFYLHACISSSILYQMLPNWLHVNLFMWHINSFMSPNIVSLYILLKILRKCSFTWKKVSLASMGTRRKSTTKFSAILPKKWSWSSWLGFKGKKQIRREYISVNSDIVVCWYNDARDYWSSWLFTYDGRHWQCKGAPLKHLFLK